MSASWDDGAPHLIVGIDFGTTYSGMAWALSTKPKDIEIISQWDTETDNNADSAKVPTRISYSPDGDIASWGFDHDPSDTSFSWFKLLLCEETKRKTAPLVSQRIFIDDMERNISRMGKTPMEITTDYLRALWSHALTHLNDKIGTYLLDNLQIKLVVTIPAIWDHQAQELTKAAAKAAGMLNRRKPTTLELCSEPEAAARYVISENMAMQIGDAFVVCDAGGGTIDLIGYVVEGLNPLRLKMCTEATGDLFGAVFLDNAFERKVSSIIGVDLYNNISLEDRKKIMSDWEHGIKRNFKHDQRAGKDWPVYIPGYTEPAPSPPPYSPRPSTSQAARNSLADGMGSLSISADQPAAVTGKLRLKTAALEDVFGEVCPRVVQLVRAQVDKLKNSNSQVPKAIFLVGGFGANKYLKEEIQRSFPAIQVRQPRGAWSAVCRGAVLKGISDETVVNHIAKYHYGIQYHSAFKDSKHLAEDKFWDTNLCQWRADRQMEWYISKGANISKSQPVTHNFFRTFQSSDEIRSLTETIYYCADTVAPTRRGSDLLKLCDLTSYWNPSIFDSLPEFTNKNGIKYRRLDYTVEMKVTSSGLDWQCYYGGVSRGRALIAADYRVGPAGN